MKEWTAEDLYLPWHNHTQTVQTLSSGVKYLGYFPHIGEHFPKRQLWYWKQTKFALPDDYKGTHRSVEFTEKAVEAALAKLENCIVLSTTPTYYSQYLAGCVLQNQGFKLLEGKCYKHPNYGSKSDNAQEHPGIPDKYQHWEHIWVRKIGEPTSIGCADPNSCIGLNNCGIDLVTGKDGIEGHEKGPRKEFLAVAYLRRGELFPEGWRRFYSGEDYKLGVNFSSNKVKKVQECDHKFDYAIFKQWEPNYEKWSPL